MVDGNTLYFKHCIKQRPSPVFMKWSGYHFTRMQCCAKYCLAMKVGRVGHVSILDNMLHHTGSTPMYLALSANVPGTERKGIWRKDPRRNATDYYTQMQRISAVTQFYCLQQQSLAVIKAETANLSYLLLFMTAEVPVKSWTCGSSPGTPTFQ